MKNIPIVILLFVILINLTGCLSYCALEGSKKNIAMRRAVLKNDSAAIRAIRLGENGVGIGIDVTNLEAIKEYPVKHILSAAGDAIMLLGAYKGVESITGDNNNNDTTTSVGQDQNNIIINGDGNTVTIVNKK